MILGSTLCSSGNIIQQIEENLSIDMSFEELIEILEEMGRSSHRIVPIYIDALNESIKPRLWKMVLQKILNMIKGKEYVRLAISFREEYSKTILPDEFCKEKYVYEIVHEGFKSNTIEAVQEFLSNYGLYMTPVNFAE